MDQNDRELLLWATAFLWETGVHNPVAATKAVLFTNLVERMTKPAEPPAQETKKEEEKPNGGK